MLDIKYYWIALTWWACQSRPVLKNMFFSLLFIHLVQNDTCAEFKTLSSHSYAEEGNFLCAHLTTCFEAVVLQCVT